MCQWLTRSTFDRPLAEKIDRHSAKSSYVSGPSHLLSKPYTHKTITSIFRSLRATRLLTSGSCRSLRDVRQLCKIQYHPDSERDMVSNPHHSKSYIIHVKSCLAVYRLPCWRVEDLVSVSMIAVAWYIGHRPTVKSSGLFFVAQDQNNGREEVDDASEYRNER